MAVGFWVFRFRAMNRVSRFGLRVEGFGAVS